MRPPTFNWRAAVSKVMLPMSMVVPNGPPGRRRSARNRAANSFIAKWLQHVIVRAAVQPRDTIVDPVASREHDDGRPIGRRADIFEKIQAITVGQSEIEYDGVIGNASECGQPFCSRGERVDTETEARQSFHDRSGKPLMIFDKQYPHVACWLLPLRPPT